MISAVFIFSFGGERGITRENSSLSESLSYKNRGSGTSERVEYGDILALLVSENVCDTVF